MHIKGLKITVGEFGIKKIGKKNHKSIAFPEGHVLPEEWPACMEGLGAVLRKGLGSLWCGQVCVCTVAGKLRLDTVQGRCLMQRGEGDRP